jgi:Zn finger protein HypA/HybF involved in hydrogenase expression
MPEIECDDCKSKYQMTDEEFAAGVCQVCGSENIHVI